jgi:hypothetical protein
MLLLCCSTKQRARAYQTPHGSSLWRYPLLGRRILEGACLKQQECARESVWPCSFFGLTVFSQRPCQFLPRYQLHQSMPSNIRSLYPSHLLLAAFVCRNKK